MAMSDNTTGNEPQFNELTGLTGNERALGGPLGDGRSVISSSYGHDDFENCYRFHAVMSDGEVIEASLPDSIFMGNASDGSIVELPAEAQEFKALVEKFGYKTGCGHVSQEMPGQRIFFVPRNVLNALDELGLVRRHGNICGIPIATIEEMPEIAPINSDE